MRTWISAAIPAVVIAAVVALAFTGISDDETTPGGTPSGPDGASTATERFLSTYLDEEGRVVRHDQGEDTVSEGQAYALLLTAEAGDEDTFDRVWTWTRQHLQRPDGLFAWRWQDGQVTDDNPAPDADLDIASALAAAGKRFDRQEFLEEARRTADAVMAHQTITVAGRITLVAGPWARADRVVNPSYLARCDYGRLAELTGDDRWRQLGDDSLELLRTLVDAGLPPDWATLGPTGRLQPIAAPDQPDGQGSYGLDAARIPARLAACPEGRELSAQLWDKLRHLDHDGADVAYSLGGETVDPTQHPLGLIGAAGAALAAGEPQEAQQRLTHAEQLDRRQPTYYGAAWLALGDTLLAAPTDDEGATPSPTMQLVASRHPATLTRPAQQPPTTTATAPSTTTTTAPTTTTTAPPTTGTTTTTAPTTTSTTATTAPTTSTPTPTTDPGTAVTTTAPDASSPAPSDTTTDGPEGQEGTSDSKTSPVDGDDEPTVGNGDDRSEDAESGDLVAREPQVARTQHEGSPEERTRRRTGALVLAGLGGILTLGFALGLRERAQLLHRNHGPSPVSASAPGA